MYLNRNALLAVLVAAGFAPSLSWGAESSVVRCAFDIGSGETKFVAVKLERKSGVETFTKLASGSAKVAIKKSVKDGQLPKEAEAQLQAQLLEFKKTCADHGATQFAGVATSGFRLAHVNGKEVLKRISKTAGIALSVISSQDEALLGYRAAETQVPQESRDLLVVWDIGGGSQQFSMVNRTYREEHFTVSPLEGWGAADFQKKLAVQFDRSEVNPLDKDDMNSAITNAEYVASKGVNGRIADRIREKNTQVIGLGGTHQTALLKVIQAHTRKSRSDLSDTYTLAEVKRLKKLLIGKTTDQIRKEFPETPYPENEASNVALVLGMMTELKIEKVRAIEVNLADGLVADAYAW